MCPYKDNAQTVFAGYIKYIITEIITLSISLLWESLQHYKHLQTSLLLFCQELHLNNYRGQIVVRSSKCQVSIR